ncbi:MORN repeat-containing protein 2 isoform X1 [Gadus macrocephalus]|uniref:MORN repeat-containing protein 2 isoform X1 n=1 Tax=Gadus macrocephalus TaxID=80720 RepID=UPI0028CB8B6B|nr:MORN repeat-containing protein 2 isoform X1 [Gadus macrocephalus]XP_059895020.1 MORN repeat-containing protein 2 isoform X1 [Gadus macrocephalus]
MSEESGLSDEGPRKVSYIFPNGDSYEGESIKSESGVVMRSGTGQQSSANGVVYTGEWQEDQMNGRGTVAYPSGAIYEGELKDNRYHGRGTYTFPDGSKYTGAFFDNRLEGEGTFTCPKGLVWTGDFHGKAALGLKLQHNF